MESHERERAAADPAGDVHEVLPGGALDVDLRVHVHSIPEVGRGVPWRGHGWRKGRGPHATPNLLVPLRLVDELRVGLRH
eukprot:11330288-Alexandrium_andersonii.AAC.1